MEKNRRGFLGVLLATAFAGVAGRVQGPAPEDLVLAMDKAAGPDMTGVVHYSDGSITHVQYGRGQSSSIYLVDEAPWIVDLSGDQIVESWSDSISEGWRHVAYVRKDGVSTAYIDGEKVTFLPDCYADYNDKCEVVIYNETVGGPFKPLSRPRDGTRVSAHGRVFTARNGEFVVTT